MKIDSNYHTHIYLCKHATGDFEDYIQKAIALGYKEFGFSDHAPLTEGLAKRIYAIRMSIDEYLNIYLPKIKEVKQKYQHQINILGGVEIEYLSSMTDIYPLLHQKNDYLILGQHYIEYLNNYYSVYSQLDIPKVIAYTEQVCAGIETGYFKILAHPDLFCWGYPFWDDICEECATKIIKTCMKHHVLLEINANGIRNCEKNLRYITLPGENEKEVIHNYAYPRIEFFTLCAKLNAPCIINDDCHKLEYLYDDATKYAYEFAHKLGVKLVDKLEF